MLLQSLVAAAAPTPAMPAFRLRKLRGKKAQLLHWRSEIPDLSVPKSRFAARCPARCPAALGVIPVLYGLRTQPPRRLRRPRTRQPRPSLRRGASALDTRSVEAPIDLAAQERMRRWCEENAPAPVGAARERSELRGRILEAVDVLEAGLVERSLEARILLLAAFCGEHLLLLGPPGTAKSLLARRLVRFVGSDAVFFERLLTRFSVPEELFGPLSLKGLENDQYVRQTTGYLPEASIAFVDEIFKANSAILNSLLSIVNERVFDNGPDRVWVPLRCLVCASNEVPETEELDALYDRLLFRLVVRPVSDAALGELLRVTRAGVEPRADAADSEVTPFPLSLEDAAQALRGAATVTLREEVVEIFKDARSYLTSKKEVVSDRRLGQAARMLQLVAWTCGRREVELCDCALLAHVLWSTLDLMQPFQHWLRGRLARGAPRPAASPARALRGLLGGLVERVESERIELDELGKELKVFEEVVQKEILEKERQQALLREHCWLAPAQQEELIEAIEEELEQGSRALLLEVYRLEEVRESMPGELANYARERRSQGELPATDPMPGSRSFVQKLQRPIWIHSSRIPLCFGCQASEPETKSSSATMCKLLPT
ncbi:unnamed protein product [Durusdinium trenchii]|uniref:AAA+ ATPase domain-containing protein n=2 Tax=Durusdinium trenchii TaxID=1381693 RepID=A0ABP0NMC0_9DINO